MENKDNDIELLAGQVWNAPIDKRRAQFDALMKLAQELPPLLELDLTEQEIDQIAEASPFFAYCLPQMLRDAQRGPVVLSPEQIKDLDLFNGYQWSAEEIAALKADIRATPFEFNRIQRVPQAEIVRRAPLPEESENMHEAPHYRDLLPPKGDQ